MKIDTFGAYMKFARKLSKKTLRQLEKETGISNAALCQYENGNSEPSFTNAARIAKALNLSLDEIAQEAPHEE